MINRMSKSDKWFFGLMAAYLIAALSNLYFQVCSVYTIQVLWIIAMIIAGLYCGIFPWQKRK
jgi:hypothetical protein